MVTLLGDSAVLQYQDAIHHPDSGEAMGYQHRHLLGCQLGKALENLMLRPRVQRSRGLVKDQKLGIPKISSRQSHLLPLPDREIHAALKAASQHLLVAVRESRHNAVSETLASRGLDVKAIPLLPDLAHGDVLRGRKVVAHKILKDDSDLAAQIL